MMSGSVAAGVLCGAAASGQFTWTPEHVAQSAVCMLMSGPFLTGYTQTINDYYDREIDAINEPYRPIPSGAPPRTLHSAARAIIACHCLLLPVIACQPRSCCGPHCRWRGCARCACAPGTSWKVRRGACWPCATPASPASRPRGHRRPRLTRARARRRAGAISEPQVITQFLALLVAGLATGYGLDVWAGHETPTIFLLAVFGSFISYIYSAPPLKLKQSGWAGNYALGSSYIALPWWAGQARRPRAHSCMMWVGLFDIMLLPRKAGQARARPWHFLLQQ